MPVRQLRRNHVAGSDAKRSQPEGNTAYHQSEFKITSLGRLSGPVPVFGDRRLIGNGHQIFVEVFSDQTVRPQPALSERTDLILGNLDLVVHYSVTIITIMGNTSTRVENTLPPLLSVWYLHQKRDRQPCLS